MRDFKMDNIKCFLIFCVIFAHMLELVGMGGLYRIIYSFHMPAFIFISGYFARFDGKKIITALIYPYFLFQTLYILFETLVLNKDAAPISLQFTTPYWLLWYLLAMIFYYLLLPFIKSINSQSILFIFVCALSVAAGFDQTIGYYLTLSRFIVFLPYFILGVILSQMDIKRVLKNTVFRIIVAFVAIGTCFLLGTRELFSVQAMYGSYSYAAANYSFLVRVLLLFVGINWIFFFLCYFPEKKIPLLSSVGKNTLILFLVHGFFRKYIEFRGGMFIYSRYGNWGLAALISLIIILVFGNKYVGSALRMFFTGQWIELLFHKIQKPKSL